MYANLKNVGKLLNSPTHQLGGLVHLNYQNTFSSGMFVSLEEGQDFDSGFPKHHLASLIIFW